MRNFLVVFMAGLLAVSAPALAADLGPVGTQQEQGGQQPLPPPSLCDQPGINPCILGVGAAVAALAIVLIAESHKGGGNAGPVSP
jgi:hypothetical protein